MATSSVVYATGSLGSWATATVLSAARYQDSSIVKNGYVYTIGDLDSGGTVTSSVFYAPLNLKKKNMIQNFPSEREAYS